MSKHPNKMEFRNAVSKGPLSRKRAAKNKDLWSIGREGIYRDAVYEAYLDICRTCKGIGNSGDDKEAIFENLAQQLERLIRTGVNNQDEFENEHEKLYQRLSWLRNELWQGAEGRQYGVQVPVLLRRL